MNKETIKLVSKMSSLLHFSASMAREIIKPQTILKN